MVEKIGHIKNPLTIIAMFAVIAEVSGTVVLPFISETNQSTYIWFLMIFPNLLIILFFLTLYFNHVVLYAPSDYKFEKHFFEIMKPASSSELQEKREENIREVVEDIKLGAIYDEVENPNAPAPDSKVPAPDSKMPAPDSKMPAPGSEAPAPDLEAPAPNSKIPAPDSEAPAPDSKVSDSSENKKSSNSIFYKFSDYTSEHHNEVIYNSSFVNSKLAEDLVLNRYSKNLMAPVTKNVVFRGKESDSGYVFDGVFYRRGKVVAIETKYIANPRSIQKRVFEFAGKMIENCSAIQGDNNNITIILVLVIDSVVDLKEARKDVDSILKNVLPIGNLDIRVEVCGFAELRNEQIAYS